jgi:hypothetical protein
MISVRKCTVPTNFGETSCCRATVSVWLFVPSDVRLAHARIMYTRGFPRCFACSVEQQLGVSASHGALDACFAVAPLQANPSVRLRVKPWPS